MEEAKGGCLHLAVGCWLMGVGRVPRIGWLTQRRSPATLSKLANLLPRGISRYAQRELFASLNVVTGKAPPFAVLWAAETMRPYL